MAEVSLEALAAVEAAARGLGLETYLIGALAELPRFELATPYYLGRKARELSSEDEGRELVAIVSDIVEGRRGYRQLLQLGREKVEGRLEKLQYLLKGLRGDDR